MKGNNLPTPQQVMSLCKSKNIKSLRLFDPNPTALQALHGSNITLILGTLNQDVQPLASDPTFAKTWVTTNLLPHATSIHFQYITVGNELVPGESSSGQLLLPAMQNLQTAITAAGLSIPVTTVVSTEVLGVSYPPSLSSFSSSSLPIMGPIISFLAAKQTPLLVNVYPYFAYSADPKDVRLDYALFTATQPPVIDGNLSYMNLFDAMVDAMYWAMEKVGGGGGGLGLVVSETGWPSDGGMIGASVENAWTYNKNVVAHVKSNAGTPKRPGTALDVYVFAMFNEDLKPVGTEQNFGLFYPNMTEVYHVTF
ncbi:putative glucan endo-1,3-beta-D-glucosidase [Dioscorea sansibarensis]